MSRINVASICPRMKLSNPKSNLETLSHWARRAAAAQANLAFFPELFITGYGEDFMYSQGTPRNQLLSLAEPVPGPTTEVLISLSRELGIYLCAGLLETDSGHYYN